MENMLAAVIRKYHGDVSRLMDILIDIQSERGHLSDWTIDQVAKALDMPRVDVEQTVSFYHFFTKEPRGRYTVYLNDSVVAGFAGRDVVKQAFESAAGCRFGSVSPDGLIVEILYSARPGEYESKITAPLRMMLFRTTDRTSGFAFCPSP